MVQPGRPPYQWQVYVGQDAVPWFTLSRVARPAFRFVRLTRHPNVDTSERLTSGNSGARAASRGLQLGRAANSRLVESHDCSSTVVVRGGCLTMDEEIAGEG